MVSFLGYICILSNGTAVLSVSPALPFVPLIRGVSPSTPHPLIVCGGLEARVQSRCSGPYVASAKWASVITFKPNQCMIIQIASITMLHSWVSEIICSACASAGCTHGDLRITGSNSFRSGRLEICSGNLWGQICDTQWDDLDAQVACRQLGFSPTGKAV